MSKPRWKHSEKSLEADRPVNDVRGISLRETHNSWELVETSRLQQQLGLLLKPIVDSGETSEGDEFPGLIARRRSEDSRIVAIGYSIEPQDALALTNPVVFGPLLHDEVTDGIDQLLNMATQIACREKSQWIRILLSDSLSEQGAADSILRTALSSLEYSCLARIGEWHRTYSQEERGLLTDLQFSTACELLAADQLRDVDLLSVTELLEDVLSTSMDLPKLPQPSALEKLSQWRDERSEILIWRIDSIPASLCVVEASMTSNAVSSIELKYVGVASRFRQQQIASRLIRCMAAHYLEGNCSVAMTVTADQSNIAAVRLYESLGFQRQSAHEVWMKKTDVGSEQTDIQ